MSNPFLKSPAPAQAAPSAAFPALPAAVAASAPPAAFPAALPAGVPMFQQASPFAGLAQAEVYQKSQYMPKDFHGAVRIGKVEYKTGEKTLVIVELGILTSNLEECPPGSERAWFCKMGQKSSMGNLKGFLAGVLGIDPNDHTQQWENMAMVMISAAQPLNGNIVGLKTIEVDQKTRNPDGSIRKFTAHNWVTIPKEDWATFQTPSAG